MNIGMEENRKGDIKGKAGQGLGEGETRKGEECCESHVGRRGMNRKRNLKKNVSPEGGEG